MKGATKLCRLCLSLLLLAAYSHTKSVTVKQGKTAEIVCKKAGQIIKITSADYGKKPGNANKCNDPNADSIVKGLCDGRTSCSVAASDAQFTSSTCTASDKQKLKVKFNCENAEAKVPTVKNGGTQTITCTGGSFIFITSASYSAGSCFSPTALTIVQGLCDDLTTCSVTADDATFADSSCDASKSEKLKISYVCQKPSGPVYQRWGAVTCPNSASLIYAGVMGGANFGGTGSGSNFLCLPTNPVVGGSNFTLGTNKGAIFGTQLITDSAGPLSNSLDSLELTCALCQTKSAETTFMYPGSYVCPSGFTVEYAGYLASEKATSGRTSKGYLCLDASPVTIDNSYSGDDTAKLYLVEGKCGALPCANYVDNNEIPCAICSM
ncbi:rhamnose-binding lectin-like [Mytilus californianus]|uniref:rhamnose-binding lectin-like n=1 Tax=Mytilus californianus TaxID=6549 RepID=UPI002245A9EC|nr:rhamnose-binding lectin-like [Mytilus californianus]